MIVFHLEGIVSARHQLAHYVNSAIRPLNFQVIPGTSPDPAVKTFIPARKTIAAARKAGLTVGAYVDKHHSEPGATQDAVQAMIKLGGLTDDCDVVCEIGPGTGRYAEEVIRALRPGAYEIYETARDWMPSLRELPKVVVRPADGHTLAATSDQSVDLVHSHKTFVYLNFYVVVGYMAEMARVVRPGGVVAFDLVTEPCLDEETVGRWAKDGTIYHPAPRDWVLDFMRRRGLELQGSHLIPLPPGKAELLVFRREG
jgi:SAM-dependent methyltransferase